MHRRFAALLLLLSPFCLASPFSVHSASVSHGTYGKAQSASTWGCSGQDTSPQVSWKGAPAGTKSFALTFYDPDAPSGSGWWHWVVVNIPVSVTSLTEGASGNPALMPAGALETNTDGGVRRYNGICPPPGQIHRYQLTVHALKVAKLAVQPDATGAMVGFMINANSLAATTLTVKAGRQ